MTNPEVQPGLEPTGVRGTPAYVALAVLVIAVALFVLLRGGSSGGGLTPIAAAAERTAAVPGARFSGTGSVSADGLNMTMSVRGSYSGATNRSEMTMDVQAPQAPQIAEMMNPFVGIQDGVVMYLSSPMLSVGLPDGKTWMKMDLSEFAGNELESSASSAGSVDATTVLGQLEAVSDGARVVGKEKVRGAVTTRFSATIDPQRQADQLREAGNDAGAELIEEQGGMSQVEVWIDRKGLVRRTAMSVPYEVMGGPGASMALTMDFYGFGVNPEIEIPSDDVAFDATELSKQLLEQELDQL